jgi:hypothetical protein
MNTREEKTRAAAIARRPPRPRPRPARPSDRVTDALLSQLSQRICVTEVASSATTVVRQIHP